ncbi:hypothetical protein COO60DRAFT_1641884 [Scenedesmus sp. NREL 46B-D3]|nr:hypothetical protein COO60DRAFT_1641884 [Scenedesmus sp. NREL 46B-D3]
MRRHPAAAPTGSTPKPRPFAAYGAVDEQGGKAWCAVTGIWWPARAAPDVPYVRSARIMGRCASELEWNVLPMVASVQAAFDVQKLCVLPAVDDAGDARFVIHIADPKLKDELVYECFTASNKRDRTDWRLPAEASPQQRRGPGAAASLALTFGQLDKQPLGLEIAEDFFGWQAPAVEARMLRTAMWAAAQQRGAGSGSESAESDAAASQQAPPAAGVLARLQLLLLLLGADEAAAAA